MDPETYNRLLTILQSILIVVCIVTTAFPILYLRSKWRKYREGRAIMFLSIGVAAAWDLTLLLQHWEWLQIHIWQIFWIQLAVMIYTILAGSYLLYALWKAQKEDKKKEVTG